MSVLKQGGLENLTVVKATLAASMAKTHMALKALEDRPAAEKPVGAGRSGRAAKKQGLTAPGAAKPSRPSEPRTRGEDKKYFAATREGMKRLTTIVTPEFHKQLKITAVERDMTIEKLILEAIEEYLARHKK
jgi:hypothetical protein